MPVLYCLLHYHAWAGLIIARSSTQLLSVGQNNCDLAVFSSKGRITGWPHRVSGHPGCRLHCHTFGTFVDALRSIQAGLLTHTVASACLVWSISVEFWPVVSEVLLSCGSLTIERHFDARISLSHSVLSLCFAFTFCFNFPYHLLSFHTTPIFF